MSSHSFFFLFFVLIKTSLSFAAAYNSEEDVKAFKTALSIGDKETIKQLLPKGLGHHLTAEGLHILDSILDNETDGAEILEFLMEHDETITLLEAPQRGLPTVKRALKLGRIKILETFIKFNYIQKESLRTIFYLTLQNFKAHTFDADILITLIKMREFLQLDLNGIEKVHTESTPLQILFQRTLQEGSFQVFCSLLNNGARFTKENLEEWIKKVETLSKENKLRQEISQTFLEALSELTVRFGDFENFYHIHEGHDHLNTQIIFRYIEILNSLLKEEKISPELRNSFLTFFFKYSAKSGDFELFEKLIEMKTPYTLKNIEKILEHLKNLIEDPNSNFSEESRSKFYDYIFLLILECTKKDKILTFLQRVIGRGIFSIDSRNSNGDTFLHAVIRMPSNSPIRSPLIQSLSQTYPELLQIRNNQAQTPHNLALTFSDNARNLVYLREQQSPSLRHCIERTLSFP